MVAATLSNHTQRTRDFVRHFYLLVDQFELAFFSDTDVEERRQRSRGQNSGAVRYP